MMQRELEKLEASQLDGETLLKAKQCGFSDRQIAACVRSTERAVRRLRVEKRELDVSFKVLKHKNYWRTKKIK